MSLLRALIIVMALILGLVLGAPAATGQQDVTDGRAFDPSSVVDPAATDGNVAEVATVPRPAPPVEDVDGQVVDGDTPEATPAGDSPDPVGTGTTQTTPAKPPASGTGVEDIDPFSPGYGAAAGQSPHKKRAEARKSCKRSPFPTSQMLGVQSRIDAAREASSWPLLALGVCVGAVVLALAAFLHRRLRADAGGRPPRKGALETVATLVAIFAAIGGLAAQFAGVGVKERPAREATLVVRDVDARITREDYARTMDPSLLRLLKGADRREVGNVVWLELGLRGYEGSRLGLQQATFDPDRGNALLSALEEPLTLPPPDTDADTRFIPVWVGYPASTRFVVEFRLLEGQAVRQLADTGKMRSSRYRYACARRSN